MGWPRSLVRRQKGKERSEIWLDACMGPPEMSPEVRYGCNYAIDSSFIGATTQGFWPKGGGPTLSRQQEKKCPISIRPPQNDGTISQVEIKSSNQRLRRGKYASSSLCLWFYSGKR